MHEHCLTEAWRPVLPGFAVLPSPPEASSAPDRPGLASALGTREMVPAQLSSREQDAVLAGVTAGEIALEHSRCSGVLKLFVRHAGSPPAAPRLEALRAYAELRRALLPQGYVVPATSLSAAGFTAGQIAESDATIAAACSSG